LTGGSKRSLKQDIPNLTLSAQQKDPACECEGVTKKRRGGKKKVRGYRAFAVGFIIAIVLTSAVGWGYFGWFKPTTLQKRYDSLKDNYYELEDQYDELEDLYKDLEKEHTKVQKAFAQLEEDFAELENIEEEYDELKEKLEEYQDLEKQYNTIVKELKDVKEELEELKEQLEELAECQEKYEELEEKYDLVVAERDALKKKVDDLKDEINELKLALISLINGKYEDKLTVKITNPGNKLVFQEESHSVSGTYTGTPDKRTIQKGLYRILISPKDSNDAWDQGNEVKFIMWTGKWEGYQPAFFYVEPCLSEKTFEVIVAKVPYKRDVYRNYKGISGLKILHSVTVTRMVYDDP